MNFSLQTIQLYTTFPFILFIILPFRFFPPFSKKKKALSNLCYSYFHFKSFFSSFIAQQNVMPHQKIQSFYLLRLFFLLFSKIKERRKLCGWNPKACTAFRRWISFFISRSKVQKMASYAFTQKIQGFNNGRNVSMLDLFPDILFI